MNFKDFCEQNKNEKKDLPQLNKADEKEVENLKNTYGNLAGKSESELLNEFNKASKDLNIDEQKAAEIENKLAPFLNAQQQQKMKNLLNSVKH